MPEALHTSTPRPWIEVVCAACRCANSVLLVMVDGSPIQCGGCDRAITAAATVAARQADQERVSAAAAHRAIVEQITYKPGWSIEVRRASAGYDYLVVAYDGTGAYGAEPWTGRRWPLSPHMTETEVVNTPLKAVLAAEEHETREQFRYAGVDLYSPHHSVQDLLAARRTQTLGYDVRANAMEGA